MGTGGFLTLGHQRILRLRTQNCIMIISFVINNPLLVFLRLCNHRLLRDFRFRYSHNGAYVMFRALPVLLIASLHRHCTPTTVFRKSPRPISISRLNMLPYLHL